MLDLTEAAQIMPEIMLKKSRFLYVWKLDLEVDSSEMVLQQRKYWELLPSNLNGVSI